MVGLVFLWFTIYIVGFAWLNAIRIKKDYAINHKMNGIILFFMLA